MTKYPNLELSYHQWTVSDYHKLAETGLLSEKRVELIGGEIIDRSPVGKLHAATVKAIAKLFWGKIGDRAIVSVQDPITLNNFSEPEPDLAILKPNDSFYADQHPSASDVLLVVEVADTTLAKDRRSRSRFMPKLAFRNIGSSTSTKQYWNDTPKPEVENMRSVVCTEKEILYPVN